MRAAGATGVDTRGRSSGGATGVASDGGGPTVDNDSRGGGVAAERAIHLSLSAGGCVSALTQAAPGVPWRVVVPWLMHPPRTHADTAGVGGTYSLARVHRLTSMVTVAAPAVTVACARRLVIARLAPLARAAADVIRARAHAGAGAGAAVAIRRGGGAGEVVQALSDASAASASGGTVLSEGKVSGVPVDLQHDAPVVVCARTDATSVRHIAPQVTYTEFCHVCVELRLHFAPASVRERRVAVCVRAASLVWHSCLLTPESCHPPQFAALARMTDTAGAGYVPCT